jgi:hypothetical protein
MRRSKYIIGIRTDIAAGLIKMEKEALAEWVSDGNSPLENPWHMCHEDNRPLSFIAAILFFKEMTSGTGSILLDYETESSDDSEMNIPF